MHWTGLVRVSNDCCKSNGCHCEIARLRWTTRRRRISIHSGEDGGSSNIAQNSKVRMSRYMDTSSTTRVAKIMVKHWRPTGFFGTTSVRTSTCWPLVGKTVRGSLNGTWIGKVRIWDVCLFIEKQGLSLSVCVDDIKLSGKKLKMAPMWKKLMKKCRSWRTNIMSWPCAFGMHSTWM